MLTWALCPQQNAAEWKKHRKDTQALLEHYMYGHAPKRPPVRSTLTATAERTEYCERVNNACTHAGNERNVTGCAMRCLPLQATQTQRNYTLRVGPSKDKTVPFDVFVYVPKGLADGVKLPFVIYNGEGFYSGVEYGDLTAQGAKELLDRGFGLALFNRNMLRKDHKTGGCATAGCSMGAPDGVQTVYPKVLTMLLLLLLLVLPLLLLPLARFLLLLVLVLAPVPVLT